MSALRRALDFLPGRRYGPPMDTFKAVNTGGGAYVWVRRFRARGPR